MNKWVILIAAMELLRVTKHENDEEAVKCSKLVIMRQGGRTIQILGISRCPLFILDLCTIFGKKSRHWLKMMIFFQVLQFQDNLRLGDFNARIKVGSRWTQEVRVIFASAFGRFSYHLLVIGRPVKTQKYSCCLEQFWSC